MADATLDMMTMAGSKADTVTVRPDWLEETKGAQAVHDAVVAYLAGRRAGTACTKTRGEVSGGGRKPYRQKGTGRARAGSIRSPIWRGGGITFGPRPRSYAKRMNRKVRALALRRAFTERLKEGAVVLLDALTLTGPRTKELAGWLKQSGIGLDVLFVVGEADRNLELASRNLPDVVVMRAGAVNPYWLLLYKKIVFTKASLDAFGVRLTAAEDVR